MLACPIHHAVQVYNHPPSCSFLAIDVAAPSLQRTDAPPRGTRPLALRTPRPSSRPPLVGPPDLHPGVPRHPQ
eukprot:11486183-Alexandrium_andersonii.AAC.1